MIAKEFIIKNKHGLHARPAALFSHEAAKFGAKVTIKRMDSTLRVDAKNVVSVLMLSVRSGMKIEVEADGDDESEAIDALSRLIACDFDEA